jgi:hypothetical protein
MQQQSKPGAAKRQYAKLLIERGVPYAEILADSALQGFNPATLRSMRLRYERKANATKPQPENMNATQMQQDATPTNIEQQAENAPKQPKKAGFAREFAKAFHPADLLYYGCVAISGAGIIQALHSIGYAVATVFFSVAVLALHFVKVRNGWARLPHLMALFLVEIGGFIAHLSWANGRLWSNVSALPLDIWVNKYRNDAGEMVLLYGGADVDKPFYIAAGVAFTMLCCGIYVVAIAIQNSVKNDPT